MRYEILPEPEGLATIQTRYQKYDCRRERLRSIERDALVGVCSLTESGYGNNA
jgi:hypothetical protein